MLRGRILAVNAEVAHAKELGLRPSGSALEHLFKLAARENLERVGVEAAYIILVRSVRIGIGEQIAVQPYLGVGAVVCIDPVYRCTLDLAAVGRISAAAFRIVGREDLGNIAVGILNAACAGDEICTLQAALWAFGIKPFVLGTGASRKSSDSIHKLREKVTFRVPASGSLGLFSTSSSSL